MNNSNNIIIWRDNYKNIKFNTKVTNPENCNLVVMQNGIIRRVKRMEDNIINPRKFSLLKCNIDANEYTVFKIKPNYFDGTWGGNVQYLDKTFSNIQEKVFIQASYSYRIYDPERAILLISDNFKVYESKYINLKVNLKIDNIIKSYIVRRLNEVGFIETQNDIIQLSRDAEEQINEHILPVFGIELVNLNFLLEESDDHYYFRKEYEWNKIKEKEVNENGIV